MQTVLVASLLHSLACHTAIRTDGPVGSACLAHGQPSHPSIHPTDTHTHTHTYTRMQHSQTHTVLADMANMLLRAYPHIHARRSLCYGQLCSCNPVTCYVRCVWAEVVV